MPKLLLRARRRGAILLAGALIPGFFNGCWDTDIAKRFREAYTPGLVAGLTTAITSPDNAEAGLRQSLAALIDGIGAILQPRTPSSAGDR